MIFQNPINYYSTRTVDYRNSKRHVRKSGSIDWSCFPRPRVLSSDRSRSYTCVVEAEKYWLGSRKLPVAMAFVPATNALDRLLPEESPRRDISSLICWRRISR
eukprot:1352600-Amorphochlora_amoeboformis.AAC.1